MLGVRNPVRLKNLRWRFAPIALAIVGEMQSEVTKTLRAFNDTSEEWKQVASNLNRLVETNEGNLNEVLEQTVVSLNDFSKTMQPAVFSPSISPLPNSLARTSARTNWSRRLERVAWAPCCWPSRKSRSTGKWR